jgi:hypothetical protein
MEEFNQYVYCASSFYVTNPSSALDCLSHRPSLGCSFCDSVDQIWGYFRHGVTIQLPVGPKQDLFPISNNGIHCGIKKGLSLTRY